MDPERTALFDEAAAALERGDRPALLAALLDAWKALRAPDVADAIDVVSADLVRRLPRIEEATSEEAQADQWLEICRRGDAPAVPWLVARLARPSPSPSWVRRQLYELERAHALDPRLAPPLMDLLLGGLPWKRSPLWTLVFQMLSALGDTRGFQALERLAPPRPREAEDAHGRRDRLVAFFPSFRAAAFAIARARGTAPPTIGMHDAGDLADYFYDRIDKLAAVLARAPSALSERDGAALASIVQRARLRDPSADAGL